MATENEKKVDRNYAAENKRRTKGLAQAGDASLKRMSTARVHRYALKVLLGDISQINRSEKLSKDDRAHILKVVEILGNLAVEEKGKAIEEQVVNGGSTE